MMLPQLEIQLIAVLVAVTCAMTGVFLVLRNMAMVADSITHTILLGIVLAFFLTHDLSSPLLIVGAAAMGVLTVWLVQVLGDTGLLAKDAAAGVVFPLLFSLAIILITRYAGSVHLDTDSVLLGELAFAPFDRLVLGGHDLGARAIYTVGALLLVNVSMVWLFLKELTLASFDGVLAAVLGFSPAVIHYALMTLTSISVVGSFQAVGAILVVAFMVGPALTARLLTGRVQTMLPLSALVAAANALLGYRLAVWLDVSIAGSMAAVTGLVFLLIFACCCLGQRRKVRLMPET